MRQVDAICTSHSALKEGQDTCLSRDMKHTLVGFPVPGCTMISLKNESTYVTPLFKNLQWLPLTLR